MVHLTNRSYYYHQGRIFKDGDGIILGFTNSYIEFYVKRNSHLPMKITAAISTHLNGEANNARLNIYVDSPMDDFHQTPIQTIELKNKLEDFHIASFEDDDIHKITILKISEVLMSYGKIQSITVENGILLEYPNQEDTRTKVEFIGDSITCGYGVYGKSDSEFHIREEDGTKTYAYYAAKALNLNAHYTCFSGYGIYKRYDGDTDGILEKVYPYTNYFIDSNRKYMEEDDIFIPDIFVINLGTNDSKHLINEVEISSFKEHYKTLLAMCKEKNPRGKVLCVCGSLCTNVYPYIESVVKESNIFDKNSIYSFEFPIHNVELDGMASGHPSLRTHEKDGERLTNELRRLFHL